MKNLFRGAVGKISSVTALMSASAVTHASVNSSDPFHEFSQTVEDWAQGGYGKGIAITSVLIGAGIAAAKNTPLPAVAGIALAALMHWGPGAINAILGTGAILL